MKNLARYVITRLLLTIPMVFILLSIVFVVLRVMPGDPVSSMLGGHAPEKVIEQKNKNWALIGLCLFNIWITFGRFVVWTWAIPWSLSNG